MARVVVLGAGMMGSAFAVPVADRGHEVRLVGTHLDADLIDGLRRDGVHEAMGLPLPDGISTYHHDELGDAMEGADILVLGVSSEGVRWAGEATAPYVHEGLPVLSITKGLEWDGEGFRLLPDVLAARWPEHVRQQVQPGAVVGPCIAGELALRTPTAVVFTSRDGAMVDRLAELFRTDYYHVRCSTDLAGMEAAAAMKNAYAMAVALAFGLDEARGSDNGGNSGSVAMHNHAAAVFAQATAEMARIIDLLGGDATATAGLAVVGDLYVTCQGGRTSRLGRRLGRGETVSEAVAAMPGVTLEALDVIRVWAEALPVLETQGRLSASELPLLRHLCAMVTEEAPPELPFERFFDELRPTPGGPRHQ